MFGMMKACGCGIDPAQRELRRMHYCGTCKTMGRLYGHGSRLFLNHDAVFLGELLTALTPSPPVFASAYISRNCLTLPATAQLPLPLQYAATANVLLTEFKLIDHIADSHSKAAEATRFLFSQSFRRARKLLSDWKFPLRELSEQLQSQTSREREANLTIDRVAEPTAIATRLIFQQGAVLIAAPNETVGAMAAIGDLFGRIIYLIDALEDREKDATTGAFNALTATATTRDSATRQLGLYRNAMVAQLRRLPIAAAQTNLFVARLHRNLRPLLTEANDEEKAEQERLLAGGNAMIVKNGRRRRSCFCCADGCCNACDGCECCGEGCCECCGEGCNLAEGCDGCGSCCDCASCCNT